MIEFRNVGVQAGNFRLENVSFKIDQGQYAVLMGKTGIGKTTILETICGLRRPFAGEVVVSGQQVTRSPPSVRNVGYVPQDLALFPTFKVHEQLSFALKLRKTPRKVCESRITDLGELLGIAHLFDRGVNGLSGGEAQRVAIGRALSFSPSVLLLDEPLSALDEETRKEMYGLLKQISQAGDVTTLHVTHNVEDAAALADVHLTLEGGQITSHTNKSESRTSSQKKDEQAVHTSVGQP